MCASNRSSSTLSVRGLSKSYGPVTAVAKLDLDVEPGEIYGLLGPNGAGKTTTIECILGLRTPDRGVVEIDGIDSLVQPEEARRRIGAQLQGGNLQDPLTPRQALAFFGSFYTGTQEPEALIRRFGLEDKADARFETLSAGQRQKLFLAMAFVHRPKVVVLDEPTSGLDPHARRELHALIREVRDDGVAVLMSTHDLAEAERLCSRVGFLDAGTLVTEGVPVEIISRSSAIPLLAIRLLRPTTADALTNLDGVRVASAEAGAWTLRLTNLNDALGSLTAWARATENEIVDLHVRRPSLEDAFVAATGRPWKPEDCTP